jgi:hypothetical protein
MVVLQSCTNSPKVVASLCNERRATSSGDLHTDVSVEVEELTDMDVKIEEISVVKVEEGTDMDIKEEEIPVVKFEEETTVHIKEEEISGGGTFPTIKGEEDQVSYMCLCSIIRHISRISHNAKYRLLSPAVCVCVAIYNRSAVVNENTYVYASGLCENVLRRFVDK